MTQKMSPLRRRMIEDMTVHNLSHSDAAILHQRSLEVQSIFWAVAGPVCNWKTSRAFQTVKYAEAAGWWGKSGGFRR